jgi:hypothetical protein
MELIQFAHNLAKHLARVLLEAGATLVTTVGDEPKANYNPNQTPSIIFYWNLLETLLEFSRTSNSGASRRTLARVICSEKSEKTIPKNRMECWRELVGKGIVTLEFIRPGWNSSSIKRHLQESYADALVIIGGGAGVEESAHLYISHGKPVLPLDIPLGSSCEDGTGGAPEMYRWAKAHVRAFIPNAGHSVTSRLAGLNYERYKGNPEKYAIEVLGFLSEFVRPQVFCARMADESAEEFPFVDAFFTRIVKPTLREMGYHPKEIIGKSRIDSPLLDIEIFKEMNRSPFSVVDVTGLRPNCLLELGYLLGLGKKSIISAKKGTALPFDARTMPCIFWDPRNPAKSKKKFIESWVAMIDRPSLLTINENIMAAG